MNVRSHSQARTMATSSQPSNLMIRAFVYNRKPKKIVARGTNMQMSGIRPAVRLYGSTKLGVTPGGGGKKPGGSTTGSACDMLMAVVQCCVMTQ